MKGLTSHASNTGSLPVSTSTLAIAQMEAEKRVRCEDCADKFFCEQYVFKMNDGYCITIASDR